MSLLDAKHRIQSIKNTAHITKAVEAVAASKMRRSQALALAGRPYAISALNMLKNILTRTAEMPLLLKKREIKKTLLAIIASDAGFAGSLNANLFRAAKQWLDARINEQTEIAVVGKKARIFAARNNKKLIRAFPGFGDYLSPSRTVPFADFLLNGYYDCLWDKVLICYTNFRTALLQETKIVEVLPFNVSEIENAIIGIAPEYGKYSVKTENIAESKFDHDYLFEPSPSETLAILLPEIFKIQIHHILLETNASEHSARMVAMKRASENAEEILRNLTAKYHVLRQANITKELTEIIAGKEALEIQ